MELLPLRLQPGQDLRQALEAAVEGSAFVVAGIGSLDRGILRHAGEASGTTVEGPLEILGLSGTVTPAGSHLHMLVSDASGRVHGGHVCLGNTIRTTAEVLLARVPGWSLTREHDPATGFQELVVRRSE